MLVNIKKQEIIEGFQKAASIIPNKTGAAYIRSIWMQAKDNNTLTIQTTDVNIEFTGTYPADVKEAGQVGVNGKAFVELIRRLPDGDIQLKIDTETNNLLIKQGRRSYKLPVSDPVWYQELPAFPEEGAIVWAGDIFHELLDRVSFCISDDDSMEALSCVCMKSVEAGKVDICGLDGHQFSIVRFINDELAEKLPEAGLLIQKKYIQEIKKWLGSDEIMLNLSDRRFHMRNINGTENISVPRSSFIYPDYLEFMARLNSDNNSKMLIKRKECVEALDRVLIFNTDMDRYTYFSLKDDMLIMSAQGQEVGSAVEEIDVKYEGSLEKIAFPTRKLIDILSHYQSETLEWVLTGSEGPCGIKGTEDPDYMVLIMPMKIAESTYYEST